MCMLGSSADPKALGHTAMLSTDAVPLLVSIPILALLGLEVWSFWRCHKCQDDAALMGVYNQMLDGLLVLSIFVLKAFLAYLLP